MNTSVCLAHKILSPKSKILFLGSISKHFTLVNKLVNAQCEVWHTEDKIESTSGYDLVISFGYRHILKKNVIESSNTPIINLHISYLPWNRGAHPNFWSFYDCTPSGVTIHLIDEGIDTGPVICQRYVNFHKNENTFSKTYERLICEIETLFMENLNEILDKNFVAIPQRRKGSFHLASDLPKAFKGWDSEVSKEIIRLDSI